MSEGNKTILIVFWKDRNSLERLLIICLLVMLIISVALIIVLIAHNCNSRDDRKNEVENLCEDKFCILAASDILRSIDEKIDPCDDFYTYTCNQWIEDNPIPNGKSSYSTFSKLEDQNQLIIKKIFESDIKEFKSEAEKKAKNYYDSCLDEDQIKQKLGRKPLMDLLEKLGGWNPINKSIDVSKWTLQDILQKSHNLYNMGGLFAWNVGEDEKDSSSNIIQIDQGGLSLPSRENYLNLTDEHERILKAYLNYMTKVTVLLGGQDEEASRKQMQEIIDFETRLAQITTPEEERRDGEKLYNGMNVTELQELAPFINWHDFLNDAFSKINRTISKDEKLVVVSPSFLQNLTLIINEYTQNDTGKIILNNYMVWQTVFAMAEYLDKDFKDAYKAFDKSMTGTTGTQETWKECVSNAENFFMFAVGASFVRKAFNGNSKKQVEEMINEIRTAIIKNFEDLKWMDQKTKVRAVDKANAITNMIGFPDYILDPEQLDNEYKELEVQNDTFFDNNLRITVFYFMKSLKKLDKPVNKTKWEMGPSVVNAYYSPNKNQVVFPAGILQSPFFNAKYPKSFNFGAIGAVMGHELTHAFDDQGSQYDKYGNLKQWWENETMSRFKEATKCFEKQYGDCTINGKHLNGIQTMGENIADNGGVKASYYAFLNSKSFAKKIDTQKLPSLNLTQEQLFFVAYSQVWCSSMTDEGMSLQIENDPHAPAKFRVNLPLSNFDEFSRVFNCKSGTKMNSKNKCVVW